MLHKSFCLSLFLMIVFSLTVFAQEDTTYVAGQVIIKVETPFSTIGTESGIVVTEQSWFNSLAQQYDISELRQVFNSSQLRFRKYYLAVFSEEYTVEEVMGAFEAESEVIYAAPNAIGEFYAEPNDEFYNLQWGLRKIKADLAWNIESGNSSVIVGILDSGTDLGDSVASSPHPDLWDNLWNDNGMYGYNARQPGEFPHDGFGHGTHVAGIAGVVMNNTEGVASVAGGGFGGDDGVQIMTVKMGSDDGEIQLAWAAEAVRWAADPDDDPATFDGAHIINMSWGGILFPWQVEVLHEPIRYADSLGVLLIAAAGNDGADLSHPNWRIYPAEFEEVLAVAASDSSDLKAWFSNFGDSIEVCAPGGAGGPLHDPEDIYSTLPWEPGFYMNQQGFFTRYDYVWGTSMASPMAAGLAALLKSYDNTLASLEIRNLITGTADPMEEQFHTEFAGKLGAGRINAYAALLAVQNNVSHPNLVYFGTEIDDSNAGNDGYINAGETVDLTVYLKNFWEDAFNVTAILSSPDSSIIVTSPTANMGTVYNRETGSGPFQIQVNSNAVPGEYALNMHVESGEYFKDFTFYLNVYNRISPGFPISISLAPNDGITTEPKIADLDGDGNREMIVLSQAGRVYKVEPGGQVTLLYSNAGLLRSAPALGDLDGDGDLEIVFTEYMEKFIFFTTMEAII